MGRKNQRGRDDLWLRDKDLRSEKVFLTRSQSVVDFGSGPLFSSIYHFSVENRLAVRHKSTGLRGTERAIEELKENRGFWQFFA
jgi:hypothetical protein